jgi:uncharacterized membrane protein YjgN (DUF898 family)
MTDPGVATDARALRFEFTGSGSEYFRIWIVNLLLTLLTLGIYSAWAKVRREKFFYQHTRLAGAGFDYHGRPAAILRGRILAFALIGVAYAEFFGPVVKFAAWAVLLLLLPWLMQRSLRFRLANSSYRGLRFGFDGTARQAYRIVGGFALLAVLLLAIPVTFISNGAGPVLALLVPAGALVIYPLLHASWRQYAIRHASFGNAPFSGTFERRPFVGIYFSALGLWLLIAVLAFVVVAVTGSLDALTGKRAGGPGVFSMIAAALGALAAYSVAYAIWPYITARVQNLCWNLTRVGGHRIASQLDPLRFVGLQLKNLLLTVVTLGLYRPFAAVATAKMRLRALMLWSSGDIETIIAGVGAGQNQALGSEAVDLLGIDFSL